MTPFITLKNINKAYDKTIIFNDFNLNINKGDFLLVFGQSGSGKSTLLNILGLIDTPDSGEYIFQGKPINYKNDSSSLIRNNKISIVFQMYYLIPKLSVLENTLSPLLYRPIDDYSKIYKQAKKLLYTLGLDNLEDKSVDFLSGGEKQRVAIARALITNPDLLLCDEPTGNLDEVNTKIIMNILKDYNKKTKKTVIVVTHNTTLKHYASSSLYLKKCGE